jgi:hypothetical protein
MIEAQLRYVLDALRFMRREAVATVDVREEAQVAFNAGVQENLKTTVWNAGGCASWYLDENGKNTTLWPTYTWKYRRLMRRFDPGQYESRPSSRTAGATAATRVAHA